MPFIKPKPKHSMCRRARYHNYGAKSTYMVTVVVKDRRPLFGHIVPEPQPRVELSPLGLAILNVERHKMSAVYSMAQLWRICIMPDHIHMIIHIASDLPDGKKLGNVIDGFKKGCTKAYKTLYPDADPVLFEKDFNDSILRTDEQLTRWKIYLADNPRRLWTKRKYPDLFKTVYGHEIGDIKCEFFGNMYLLNYPDRMAVIVHRADHPEPIFSQKKAVWLEFAARGGVLVSAAISPKEKEVIYEALEMGAKVIKIRDNGFQALFKPSGIEFDYCAQGQMLFVSRKPYEYQPGKIARQTCLDLNELARQIATIKGPWGE